MFNSVVFDVVIGLVLIYLLYSLLVTILGEIIATWTGLRSRLLRLAIEKMLNDGYHRHRTKSDPLLRAWQFIQRFFLKEFEDFKYSFAGKFYEQPSIKYLSNKASETQTFWSQTKPSYFTDNNFADTLINLLRDKGAGDTDSEKIAFCLKFNTHHIEPETLKNINRMFTDAGGDVNLFKGKLKDWFNETNDRCTGWYKRKMQLILFWLGFIIALAFNVDSIKIARLLAKDEDARSQLVKMGVELAKDSARYTDFIVGNGDTIHSKAIIDSGYARVSKDISEANLILGLGWNFDKMRKEDSCEISKKSDKYETVLKLKQRRDSCDLIYKPNEIEDNKRSLGSQKKEITSLIALLADTAIKNLDTSFIHTRQQQLSEAQKKHITDSLNFAPLLAASKQLKILIDSINRQINEYTDNRFSSIDSIINTDVIVIKGKRPYDAGEKLSYVFNQLFNGSSTLIGLIITGLMLSLGAPFWFDLLKKLVAIRGSGVKPEEKKEEEKEKAEVLIDEKKLSPLTLAKEDAIATDAVNEAVKVYAVLIKQIPGVKSVFSVKVNGTKKLQINVDTATTENAVKQRFPSFKIKGVNIPVNIVVSGVPVTHESQELHDGNISNKSGNNGFGSLGCVLQRKDTGSLYILSCWHVLKGNTNYSFDDSFTTIVDHTSKDLAERRSGGIQGAFDYGLARCFSNAAIHYNQLLKTTLNISDAHLTYTEIKQTDIDDQAVIKYYNCFTQQKQEGKIFTDSSEVIIEYADKSRVIKDVILLTQNTEEKPISKPGNSGAVVFDKNNKAIAMIIGADKKYTYAIKLSNIFSIHSEMIIA